MKKTTLKTGMVVGSALASSAFSVSLSSAALLVDFKPQPLSDASEVAFVTIGAAAPALKDAEGSRGNGDGNLAVEVQTPGGLWIETPFSIPGAIDGKVPNPLGSTSFLDVTMLLTGLEASGPAVPAGERLYQPLGPGKFELQATNPSHTNLPTVLLSGWLDDALIIADARGQGAVLSATVHYSGGEIYKALASQVGVTGGTAVEGQLSWSLLNMRFSPSATPSYLGDFTADTVGQFSYIPEPSVLSLLAGGTLALLGRRRRRA